MKRSFVSKGAFWALLLFCLFIILFSIKKIKFRERGPAEEAKQRFRIANIVRYFPFSKANSLKEWEEKILRGRVVYRIEKGQDLSYVRAESKKAASALYYKVKLDIDKHPVISWKWRVNEFPKRILPERIEDREEEDFAARVYVIFPAVFFTRTKIIEYIWSETLPAGTVGTSGYSKNIKLLVLEKGKASGWHLETRDIYEDYIKLHGEKPTLDIGAIAFMTDADSTKTTADAVYDEIQIGYE